MGDKAESASQSLGCYVSRLLIEQLHHDFVSQNRENHEFDGVILFCDIVNSTPITRQFESIGPHGAEALAARLNSFFDETFEAVATYGGDVIRLDGDAVIALWRAEPDLARAAEAACGAALRLKGVRVRGLPGDSLPLRKRITLAAGRLSAIRIDVAPDRAFLVLGGPPIRTLGTQAARGEPETVVVSGAVATLLGPSGILLPGPDGTMRLAGLRAAARPAPEHLSTIGISSIADLSDRIRRFIPRVLAERTEAGHTGWLAEFRTVTVVDVSLPAVADVSEVNAGRLRAAIQELARAIQPMGCAIWDVVDSDKGLVVRVAFGLPPYARENNAVWAVQAAWQIGLAFSLPGQGCGIGIATGRVFCGIVGTERRREYLSTGPVMSLAARLMQAAGRDILCDEQTIRAAREHFAFGDAEPITLKGFEGPIAVHRLIEPIIGARHAKVPAFCLIGRECETRVIEAQFERLCGEGRGGFVIIEAEPGAGKSKLLMQARDIAVSRDCTVIVAGAEALEQASPYSVMRQVLPQLVCGGRGLEADRGLLRERLTELLRGAPLEARAALLEDIMPLGLPDRELAAHVTGQGRVAGIAELLTHIAGVTTRARRCVLLLDDLHWIDASSAQLLATMVRRVPALLVLTATRPLEPDASPNLHVTLPASAMRIVLPPLGRDIITAIICRQLGVRSLPPRLAEYVYARSGGIPFHAEQLVLSLGDHHAIVVADGRCRLAQADLEGMSIPETLRGVVVSRIDMVPAEQQLALKVASVIGRRFDVDVLRRIHPFGDRLSDLRPILESLVQMALLDVSGAETYSFHHAMIRDATYDLLTFGQRRTLHRRVAGFIEDAHRGALEPYYSELAQHWEGACDLDRASEYHERAAVFALSRYANYDALMHAERIERLKSRSGENFEPARRSALARIRGDACHELSRFGDAGCHFLECAALNGIPVPVTGGSLMIGLAAGTARQAAARLGIAPIKGRRECDALAAHIFLRLAEHAYFESDGLRVCHFTLASLNRAERTGAIRELVEGYGGLAIGLASTGTSGLARFYRQRSLSLAHEQGSLHDQGFANLLAAVCAFGLGDWAAAIDYSDIGAKLCRELGDRFREQSCRVVLGHAHIGNGDYASAEEIFGAYGEEAEEIENIPVRAWLLAGRAGLDMILGRPAPVALARLAAARDDTLHRAERLLCDGIEAAAHLQNGDTRAAGQSALGALNSMLESPPTMAIVYLSASAAAEVLLTLAERGSPSDSLLEDARRAGTAMRRCAAKIPICRPRADWLNGRIALLEGHRRRARSYWLHGLKEARRLGMKLEQALLHQTMAEVMQPEASIVHRAEGTAMLRILGAAPWLGANSASAVRSNAFTVA